MDSEDHDLDGGLDVGPPGPVVFLRLESDDLGRAHACFATADGESFTLGRAALELRRRALGLAGEDAEEERRALAPIARR